VGVVLAACTPLGAGQPPAQVRERFAACHAGDVVVSAITRAELEFGVACSPEAWTRNQAAWVSLLEDIQAVLVTNKESDFLAFPGLFVENWVNAP
jgi:tRNA(fMet)-specific endonuclease VapC